MRGFVLSYCILFCPVGCYLLEVISLLKNGGGVEPGERRGEGVLRGVERGETVVRVYCKREESKNQ